MKFTETEALVVSRNLTTGLFLESKLFYNQLNWIKLKIKFNNKT